MMPSTRLLASTHQHHHQVIVRPCRAQQHHVSSVHRHFRTGVARCEQHPSVLFTSDKRPSHACGALACRLVTCLQTRFKLAHHTQSNSWAIGENIYSSLPSKERTEIEDREKESERVHHPHCTSPPPLFLKEHFIKHRCNAMAQKDAPEY
jgi:hypothetical protein